jgi:hypothetical protein
MAVSAFKATEIFRAVKKDEELKQKEKNKQKFYSVWDAVYGVHVGLMRRSFVLFFYFIQTQSSKTKEILGDGAVKINP